MSLLSKHRLGGAARLRPFLRSVFPSLAVFAALIVSHASVQAQNLSLEGSTGGFLVPTAYVVPVKEGKIFSAPAVGFRYIHAGNVIGDVQALNVTEGLWNKVEVGYTRSIHTNGNNPYFSPLWEYSGMNIVHGKVSAVAENFGGHKWAPAIGTGFVVRTGDRFVSGALDHKSYTNGDVYAVATKTLLDSPVPMIIDFGFKGTNGVLFGIGGQSTRFQGRLFGGIGFPLPGPWKTVIVPAAGFTQQPTHVKNLPGAHIPTTLDYAVRVTRRKDAHFAFDAGVGQVAGRIMPNVDLNARAVFGMGLSYMF